MRSGNVLKRVAILAFFLLACGGVTVTASDTGTFPIPAIPRIPHKYICCRAATAPVIDGRLDDACWQKANWTDWFVDIEGPAKPAPRFGTRVKMCWDSDHFYVAAWLEEPHVWATLTERDAVIYHDNDFEVFIDPDGDNHLYYELEINALGTVWDLLLVKPYRDGGPAVDAWDIQGLQSAVHVDGTLNDPSDTDRSWSVELAFPWAVLGQCSDKPAPPADSRWWRVNFSRVQWQAEVEGGQYLKVLDSETGRPLPEDNWVWSPQGLIAMHYPEMWGYVFFSDKAGGENTILEGPEIVFDGEAETSAVLKAYYRQKAYQAEHGQYASRLKQLRIQPQEIPEIHLLRMEKAGEQFEIACPIQSRTGNSTVHISHDGRLWYTRDE